MPTSKRASMREGPLTALFRKTAEEEGTRGVGAEDAGTRGAGAEEAGTRGAGAEEAMPSVGGAEDAGTRGAGAEEARPSVGGAEDAGAQIAARQAAPGPEPAPEAEPHIRSPQERLRQAFSADIPENVLDRPAPKPEPEPEPEPDVDARRERDVYARPERVTSTFAAPAPIGTPVLRVVGVGGAGVNAVNRMIEAEIEGVEFLAINTDLQSLQSSAAHETLHIGEALTRGLGSGSDPDLGRQSAREEYDRIKALLRGSDMVFITAGAGGGTGTGAAPVVAEISRELGALTVGIVTRPFQFEGSRRRDQAEAGIAALAAEVDTLIVVPNNRLLTVLDRNTSMVEAFRVADDVLRQGVQGICDLVTLPGLINLDFADVRTIMAGAGNALLGIGMGSGDRRAIDAAEKAVASPLLETSMEGARSILLSITGGRDLSLWEVGEAAKAVAEAAHPDANIIFGAMVDEKLDDQVWVTVVATGYGDGRTPGRERERSRAPQRNGVERRQPLRGREPAGEPRVSRVRQRPASSPMELDVPEFLPRR